MILNQDDISFLEKKILNLFKEVFNSHDYLEKMNLKKKSDRSLVTALDIKISKELKKFFKKKEAFKKFNFLSEEEEGQLSFPCIIVDPIDGTKEMARGIPECVISLAIMESCQINGIGWLFNPFTGFSISTRENFIHPPSQHKMILTGFISRTEDKKGFFENYDRKKISLTAKGSIAYKLGLLAAGACDFVISRGGKNIWDIAGGTLICQKRGINCYLDNKKIDNLGEQYYKGPLLWCRESAFSDIKDALGFHK